MNRKKLLIRHINAITTQRARIVHKVAEEFPKRNFTAADLYYLDQLEKQEAAAWAELKEK